jgi:hypothetical protein
MPNTASIHSQPTHTERLETLTQALTSRIDAIQRPVGPPALEDLGYVNMTSLRGAGEIELVRKFSPTAKRLGEAVVSGLPASRKTDRLFAIKAILRERGRDARLKLAPLLKHENRFVRYYAARELIGLLPEQCRVIIEENTKEFDALVGDARHFLRAIDEGIYKPD